MRAIEDQPGCPPRTEYTSTKVMLLDLRQPSSLRKKSPPLEMRRSPTSLRLALHLSLLRTAEEKFLPYWFMSRRYRPHKSRNTQLPVVTPARKFERGSQMIEEFVAGDGFCAKG